jgi:dipeptidyl aminopeptidase/acylaminoacyl peptidase
MRKRSLALGMLAVPASLIALHAYRAERRVFRPRSHRPRMDLLAWRIPGLVEASFPSRTGDRLRGYYAPSRNGAAVVLLHGSGGERSDLVHEARLLAEAGVGVLLFDWPGHGESEGKITWGESERQALEGALDWLAAKPGVDPRRLGAFGFSMGGYILAQVAAADLRLRAVALAGAPHDAREHTLWEYRRLGWLRQWPALLAVRVSGMQLDELVPERVVGRIAPRRLLLIAGSEDTAVPLWMTERLHRAAGEPRRLLVIRGAGHGAYHEAAGETYARELLDFFSLDD